MTYEATGTLYKKFDAEQITQRFRKRELIVEMDSRYPQYVSFQLTGDRCELLDEFQVGDELTLTFRLRGREWTGRDGEVRYFNSLDVLEIGQAGDDTSDEGLLDVIPPPSDADMPVSDEDLPF